MQKRKTFEIRLEWEENLKIAFLKYFVVFVDSKLI